MSELIATFMWTWVCGREDLGVWEFLGVCMWQAGDKFTIRPAVGEMCN